MSFIHRTIPMLAFAAGCAAFAPAAFAQLTPVTLVSFTGKNGQTPLGSLLADASGNLYGTTYLGGASKAGTVFELSPPAKGGTAWTETVLASFNGANGENPWAELIADKSGNLYSTTSAGGAANDGTIFQLSPPAGGSGAWTLNTLLSFAGADGANPLAGLVADASGNLYGTASTGGANACLCGTVVEVSPPSGGGAWTETVLTSLTKSVGARPSASLFLDKSGKLYGTTRKAGASHSGAVFKLTPPGNGDTTWTAADLVGFTGQNGSLPIGGLIQDSAKNFYGTTLAGGPANVGTVYELSPPAGGSKTWTETMLYSFTIPTGESPHGSLIADAAGNLYGTTAGGGANHKGTVYELSPPTGGGTVWTETILVSFNGTNGAFPSGSLIADASGNLYGTTSAGGAANRGTVFEIEGTGFKVK